MLRRIVPALLALAVITSCAGPSKLAQKSDEQFAAGDYTRAWQLATRALDRDPGNPRARAAAEAAGNALARDWEQRIHVLAQSDSMAAAEQVLALSAFRVNANRYAPITVSPGFAHEETTLRQGAARVRYRAAQADLAARRPKRAWLELSDVLRFAPDYRDAATLSDRVYERAVTRVAVVPFLTGASNGALGRDVASQWRDNLTRRLTPPDAHFTRVLGGDQIEQQMTVAQLGSLSREGAIALARKAGAERVVWGSIGGVDSQTRFHVFTDVIARRFTEKNDQGESIVRWADVPVEVLSRVRTVTVDVDYELIATREGATIAHQHSQRSTSARVVWTSFAPEGDLDAYALVSDAVRAANPERARAVESRWHDVCGDNTTVQQVFEARRTSRGSGRYDRTALPRFMAGAGFVFLQELPPAQDLAFAALADGWKPVGADLLRLDAVDDVDLGMAAVRGDDR